MRVSVERAEGLERTLRVEIPAQRVEDAIEQRLTQLQREARLDGFRPGKVPRRVVRDRFGGQVRQEVVGELIQATLQEAVDRVELQPAGQPRIDAADEQPVDGGIAYRVTFEVYPEIDPGPLSDLEITRPNAEVTEADVDNMVEKLRAQRCEYTDVDRPAARGDRVIIDFTGRIGGEPFEGGSGQDTAVELGAGQMIQGLEEQLEGIGVGERREIEVTFPEQFANAELAAKTAVFDVTAKAVQERRLPPVDEEFARAFGVESGSIEELRAGLRRNMERELHQALRAQLHRQVMDALLQRNPVDVPEGLIGDEIGRLRDQMRQRAGGQVGDDRLDDEGLRAEAERRVRLGLILQELVRRSGASADEESIRAKVQEMASAYEDPAQVVQHYYQNREMLQGVEAIVIEEKVVDWVLDQARVSEQPTSFDAVMNG